MRAASQLSGRGPTDANVSAEIDKYPSLRFQDIRNQETHVSRFAHLIKTAIAYLQMACNFFQYCYSN